MIVLVVLILLVALVAFALTRLGRKPNNNPTQFLRRQRPAATTIVACVGASTVQGQVSFNFVDYLNEKFKAKNCEFINAGKNGDLAYNVLQRMPEVLRCKPKYMFLLIGGNDVIASLNPKAADRYIRSKHLPEAPSIESYEANVRKIVNLAKQGGV
jgi:lysophospholipase L1-like esterase